MQIIYNSEKAKEILELLSVGKIEKLYVHRDITADSEVYVIDYEILDEPKPVVTKTYAIFKEFIEQMDNDNVRFFNLAFVYGKENSCNKAYKVSKPKEEEKKQEKTYTSSELKQLLIDQLTKEGKIDKELEVYNKVQGKGKQNRYIPMTVGEVLNLI